MGNAVTKNSNTAALNALIHFKGSGIRILPHHLAIGIQAPYTPVIGACIWPGILIVAGEGAIYLHTPGSILRRGGAIFLSRRMSEKLDLVAFCPIHWYPEIYRIYRHFEIRHPVKGIQQRLIWDSHTVINDNLLSIGENSKRLFAQIHCPYTPVKTWILFVIWSHIKLNTISKNLLGAEDVILSGNLSSIFLVRLSAENFQFINNTIRDAMPYKIWDNTGRLILSIAEDRNRLYRIMEIGIRNIFLRCSNLTENTIGCNLII